MRVYMRAACMCVPRVCVCAWCALRAYICAYMCEAGDPFALVCAAPVQILHPSPAAGCVLGVLYSVQI